MNVEAVLRCQLSLDAGTVLTGHHLGPFQGLNRAIASQDRFGEPLEFALLHVAAGLIERGQCGNRAERGVDPRLQGVDFPDRSS